MSDRPLEPVPRLALSVKDAAWAAGVPEGTLRDALRRRELAAVRVGGGRFRARWVVRIADLEAWLAARLVPTRAEQERSALAAVAK